MFRPGRLARILLPCVLASAFAACAAAPARPHAPAKTPLVVFLVVDQLAAWELDDRLPLLPADGGFHRLVREGTRYKELLYQHAATDTAPGHAALFTGQPPAGSGIFGNEAFLESAGARDRVSILRDDATRLLGPDGPLDTPGSSLARLAAPTLADRLRAAHPDAAIVALSLKDRGALFAGGHQPTASLFYEPARDLFVTSSAVATSYPDWARPLARPPHRPWEILDRAWLARVARLPDDQPGEGDWHGLGSTFPHPPAPDGASFRATPDGDAALVDLALAAVDGAHLAGRPALLAVSLSSHDYVSHVFGPDSWEALDLIRRLDGQLARLFAGLDAKLGPDGWAAVLAADHGSGFPPEEPEAARPWCRPGAPADRWRRPCRPGERLLPTGLGDELDAAAHKAVPEVKGRIVDGIADPWVWLSSEAARLPAATRDRIVAAMARAAAAHPGVYATLDPRTLPRECPPIADLVDAPFEALVCRARPPGDHPRLGLYVAPRPGSYFDTEYVTGHGSSHGSPWRYDRAVPLLVRAPGRVPAGQLIDEPRPFSEATAQAARLLNLPATR